jgi:lysophospholipase L1-like esterase
MFKKNSLTVIILFVVPFLAMAQIRVACIGNSITDSGKGRTAYPAQLQFMLGDGYVVKNFGVGGRTILKKGDYPYWETQDYKDALAFQPDLVFIKLGTNDSKPQNWKHKDDYIPDYEAFIKTFPKSKVVLLTPVPAYEIAFGINPTIIQNEILPRVYGIGKKMKCDVVDLYTPLSNNLAVFPDKIHPDPIGLSMIAEEVYKYIVTHPKRRFIDVFKKRKQANINLANVAKPGVEYRKSVGWQEGKDWWSNNEEINQQVENHKDIDILFLGNSITQGWGGAGRPTVSYRIGEKAANTFFKGKTWINAGIASDKTQHLLWRLQHNNYAQCNPKTVVISIGVNNFTSNTPEEIVEALTNIVATTRAKMPNAKILLFGPLPAGLEVDSYFRGMFNQVHELLAPKINNQPNLLYINALSNFMNPDGDLDLDLFENDGVHLKEKGYRVWGKLIEEML